jgi:hypothetical protein
MRFVAGRSGRSHCETSSQARQPVGNVAYSLSGACIRDDGVTTCRYLQVEFI